MGEDPSRREPEIAALRLGLNLGMNLIDTAEMYGEGGAEEIVGEAIAEGREDVFVVSKVYPHNATRSGAIKSCERSLRRLKTDYIDLYLLHWRGDVPLAETVEAFQQLRETGKILEHGVSNFDVVDMEEWVALPGGDEVATNQVLYNLMHRGIDWDLIPWSRERQIPIMAYSPVAHKTDEQKRMFNDRTIKLIAAEHGAKVAIAEESRWGGTCVVRGCVPKKLMVYASEVSRLVDDARGQGWTIPEATFDWPTFIAGKDKEIARLTAAYRSRLERAGVRLIEGRARLVDAHTLEVNGERITAAHVLVATGGRPRMPAPREGQHWISSDEAFHLPALPRRIAILGAGYIGVEFAHIFAGFGSKVTLVHRHPRVLSGFADEVTHATLALGLTVRDLSILIRTIENELVLRAEWDGSSIYRKRINLRELDPEHTRELTEEWQ